MTANHADQLIDGYLARPRAEACSRESEETDASVLNILDRLGEPATVVTDARERLGIRQPQPYRPGFLEVAAVILVPFLWPIVSSRCR